MEKVKAIITGATGMVGQGVLLECLESPDVESVLVVGRSPVGVEHPKLRELLIPDFFDLSGIRGELAGYNACYFCLGVSSAGMNEDAYRKITYDLTLNFAETLESLNPGMTFCYVSGTGTDSTEKGRIMWARVKGKTENELLDLPFKAAYMFRPGYIHPMKGVQTKTKLYAALYALATPLYPLLKRVAPKYVTTTENVGKAMINCTLHGYPRLHLENNDINKLAGQTA